jgi:hypothetical protein
MTAGGRVEMRAKTLGNLGTWLPVFGVADLSQLQGSLPDADFDKLFDFRVP